MGALLHRRLASVRRKARTEKQKAALDPNGYAFLNALLKFPRRSLDEWRANWTPFSSQFRLLQDSDEIGAARRNRIWKLLDVATAKGCSLDGVAVRQRFFFFNGRGLLIKMMRR